MVKTKLRLSYLKLMGFYVLVSLALLIISVYLSFSGRGLFSKSGGIIFEVGLFCLVGFIEGKSWERYGYTALYSERNKGATVDLVESPIYGTLWCGVGAWLVAAGLKEVTVAYVRALAISVLAVAVYSVTILICDRLDHRDYQNYRRLYSEISTDGAAETSFSQYAIARSKLRL